MTVETAGAVPAFVLADRLRKAREHAGLGQVELAERMGVNRNTVGNAEKGHVQVRRITIKMWAMATGVSQEWLETGNAPAQGDPDEGDGSYARRDLNPQPAD